VEARAARGGERMSSVEAPRLRRVTLAALALSLAVAAASTRADEPLDGKVEGLNADVYRAIQSIRKAHVGELFRSDVRTLRRAILKDGAIGADERDLVAEILSGKVVQITPAATPTQTAAPTADAAARTLLKGAHDDARCILACIDIPDPKLLPLWGKGAAGLGALAALHARDAEGAAAVGRVIRAKMADAWLESTDTDAMRPLRVLLGDAYTRSKELPRGPRRTARRMLGETARDVAAASGGAIRSFEYEWLLKDPEDSDSDLRRAREEQRAVTASAKVRARLAARPGAEELLRRHHAFTIELLEASLEDAGPLRDAALADVVTRSADLRGGLPDDLRAGLAADLDLPPRFDLEVAGSTQILMLRRRLQRASDALDARAENYLAIAALAHRAGSPSEAWRYADVAHALAPSDPATAALRARQRDQHASVQHVAYEAYLDRDLGAATPAGAEARAAARKTLAAKAARGLAVSGSEARTRTLRSLREEFAALLSLAETPEERAAREARIAAAVAPAQKGEPLVALRALDALLAEDPARLAARRHRALLLASLRSFSEAVDEAEAAGALCRPEEAAEAGSLADAVAKEVVAASRLPAGAPFALALSVARARQAILHGDAFAVDRLVLQALTLDPKCAPALLARAKVKLARQDATGAREDVEAAVKADPRSAEALGCRAQLRLGALDAKGAEADIAAALLLDPANPEARTARAQAALARADAAAAAAELDELVKLHPTMTEAYTLRGQVAMQRGDRALAVADFVRAGESDPLNLSMQLALADALARLGDIEAARRRLATAAGQGDKRAQEALARPPFAAAPAVPGR